MNEQPSTPQAPKQSFWAKLFGGKKKQEDTNQTTAPQPVSAPVTEMPQASAVADVAPATQFAPPAETTAMPGASLIGNEVAVSTAPAPTFEPAAPVQTAEPIATPEVAGYNEQPVAPVSTPDPVTTPEVSVGSTPSLESAAPGEAPVASFEPTPAPEQSPADFSAVPQPAPEQPAVEEQTPPPAPTAL